MRSFVSARRTLLFHASAVVALAWLPLSARAQRAPGPLDDATVSGDLALLDAQHWLVPGAMVVVERSTRSPEPTWPAGIEGRRSKRYGETTLWYGHAAASPEEA